MSSPSLNHQGVSCNACRKNNFRGLRYKCLICHDYDLCAQCFDDKRVSSRHNLNHPMQCIVSRSEHEIYYSGEPISEQSKSLTCPLCGALGFTEITLADHVSAEHPTIENSESTSGVMCPICGLETNQFIHDFASHLAMEHKATRDPVEQLAMRGGRGGRCHIRSNARGRRSQPQYSAVGGPTNSTPSTRESADPLVEILAQLSGVRRTGGSTQSPASQLHQLQMHLQSSPSYSRSANEREREVRIMRRTFQSMNNQLNSSSANAASISPAAEGITTNNSGHYSSSQPFVLLDHSSLSGTIVGSNGSSSLIANQDNNGNGAGTLPYVGQAPLEAAYSPRYLLSRCTKPIITEAEQQQREILKADRSLFVQELLVQIGLIQKTQ